MANHNIQESKDSIRNPVPNQILIENMFSDLAKFQDNVIDDSPVLQTVELANLLDCKVATIYMSRRDELIGNLFRLGRKFKQR